MLTILLLVVLLYGLLHIPSVQTWVVKKVAGSLSRKLNTNVTVKSVDLSFFDKLAINGVMVEDRAKDTLLYAGAAKVRLTDWFFIKDHITISYVALEDAVVNMNRKDSVWNYQFLIDYFGGPTSTTKDTAGGIEFDLKVAKLKNIRFNRVDNWIGQSMNGSIGELDLAIDEVDMRRKKVVIRQLDISQPLFAMGDYDGTRPDETVVKVSLPKLPRNGNQWNDGWEIGLKKLSIKNGSFKNDQQTERQPYVGQFDGQHLLFSVINGTMSDLTVFNDTITGNINLSAKEKSGFEVKKLSSLMKFTPEMMEFNELDLQTNTSRLGNYYSMRFESFNKDMKDFLSKVQLEANFTDSKLTSDDLAYFAPELASWKKVFYLEGKAKGTVDNFSAKKMKIKSGNTFMDGDLDMRGLPDINSTFIDLRANNFQTTYGDLVILVPTLKKVTQPQLSKLGNINFKGNFTGFINDFVTYGTLVTNLGTITSDLNMKLPDNGKPQYSGKINTNNFRLGQFINSSQVGNITINGNVRGSGFDLKELNAKFDGTVRQIQFNGYNFQNIAINGNFEKSLFKGHLTVNDPNLKIKSLDGTLSLTGKQNIAVNLLADLQYANLKKINFLNNDISLSGLFSLDFTGNNIDNFLGTARIFDAQLRQDTTLLSFDSLRLNSYMKEERKYLSLQTNQIEAEINGMFQIAGLPDAFKLLLNRYYPAYIPKPRNAVNNQNFIFDIKTREVEQYVKLLDQRLSGFNYSTISGSLNLASSELYLNANVPNFAYDGKTFTNTVLSSNGNRDTLKADIFIEDIALSDSLHFPGTNLQLTANNDVSQIYLKTSAGKTLNDAEINASIQTFTDGVKIHFSPSSFIINDKKWLLEKDGELTIRKKYLDASEIKFVSKDQQIVISTEMDELTDQTHIVANLTKVDLGDFTPFLIKDPSIKGRLTGRATVRNPFGKIAFDFKGRADSFALNDKYVGAVDLDASANTNTGLITFKADANDSAYVFSIDGSYNYKDSTENQMAVNLIGNKVNLSILEPYLGSIFSKMDGIAETNLKIVGGPEHRYILGNATILNGSLMIGYTQCEYWLSNQPIAFKKDEIDLGIMKVRDSLNNEGTLSGRISHRFFDKLLFQNVGLETSKLLLLNTTKKDNEQFYGNVIGSAKLSINGPTTNLLMNIDGQPSIFDSSHIYVPTGDSKEGNTVDYIDFIQFGTKMEEQFKRDESTNILVNLNIQANPACKVDVILDEETGDIIKAQGNGLINVRVGTREPLGIRGRYELTKGEYTFNFQTLLKKPFTLKNGGSITWNGDPYAANIDIAAEYVAEQVDISQLSSSGRLVQKEDVIIVSHLSGVLQKPEIKFEFLLPGEAGRDYIVVKRLQDFQNDPNEMNKQVASLLLFNSFILGESNFLTGGNTLAIATNTIGGVVSAWLMNLFNKQLERATKGVVSTYIDINPTLDLQRSADQLQASVRVGVKLLLSNRLVFLVGGNLDYNNSSTQQLDRKGLVTPDINIEWLLNKEGSIRVVGFNRSSIDFALIQRNRSGIQLTYRKDMNKLSDIFKSKKEIDAKANGTKVIIK